MLTGKYSRGVEPQSGTRMASFGDRAKRAMSDDNFSKVERLAAYAAQSGHTILDLAMSWLASQPHIPSVIAGATSADQARQNAAAVTWQMNDDELSQVDELTK